MQHAQKSKSKIAFYDRTQYIILRTVKPREVIQ